METWHLFDNLTFFFDILTQTYNLNYLSPSQSWLDLSNVSNCQKDVKFQKANTWTMEEVHKKYINIIRFTHTDINFDVKYDGTKNPQNVQRKYYDKFWWPSYLMSKLTSKCVNLIMSIYFFVDLLHSLNVWHLTCFWQYDIFLTI